MIAKYPRMMTFKQLEALYWIVELGGFAASTAHSGRRS
jgi:hypothetical protein